LRTTEDEADGDGADGDDGDDGVGGGDDGDDGDGADGDDDDDDGGSCNGSRGVISAGTTAAFEAPSRLGGSARCCAGWS